MKKIDKSKIEAQKVEKLDGKIKTKQCYGFTGSIKK